MSFQQSSVDVSTSTSTKGVNPMVNAFAKEAAINAVADLITAWTWNGDATFGSMGDGPGASMLSLDNRMVRQVHSAPSARRGYKATPTKHHAPTPTVIDEYQRQILDERFDEFVGRITSLPMTEQARWWSMMFRYVFYLRNLRGEGKRERLLFYYLFDKVHAHYPKTAEALIFLIPDYGYFGDLDYLLIMYATRADGAGVVKAALNCYAHYLNADAIQVFGKKVGDITADEADQLNTKLKAMTSEELSAFRKGKKLSLAAKWFKREGKKDSDHVELFIEQFFFPNGGFSELKTSSPAVYKKRANYSMMRLRKIITALTQCLAVGEQLMTATDSPADIQRDWSDIDMEHAPAAFATKYRKALLNESLTAPLSADEVDTGNRSSTVDRVACRKNTLNAILGGKLKGANSDLANLAKIVMGYMVGGNGYGHASLSPTLTSAERSLISQQWRDMMKSVSELVEEAVKLHADDPEFLDPREAIFVVDTSGSMSSANVQHIAVALGLLGASISTMPGCLISFSDRPELFKVDLSKDVFDQFLTVLNGPTGLKTNIDATYRLVLDLMEKSGTTRSTFALVYLTDGQFDSGLVHFENDSEATPKYGYGYGGVYGTQGTKKHFEQVFLGRMEKAFASKGFTLPRTVFWNLNGMGDGYSATADIKGVQMVSGFSQTIMRQVLSGEYKQVTDPVTGASRVDVDPWTSFAKAVSSATFEPVLRCVLDTKEGVFGLTATSEV